ncbi:MAG: hypothetical protein Q4D21_00320 [Phascolarctobacterium sp.]|nr:hypothetical protein [Phascolarctobacterium sp.]
MFLVMLNKKEQEYFLELANIAMNVDGVIMESELHMLEMFRKETDLQEYVIKNIPIDKLKIYVDTSTKRNKKVFLFELAGMLYADEEIAPEERDWLFDIATSWGFRESEMKKIIRWVMDFNDLLAEGFEYINQKERL